QGVEERFKRLGLDTIWSDLEAFAASSQWHQYAALKFQIETMRRQASIAGYVITVLSDIYWESNGLLDFMRCPKVFHNVFSSINTPDVIVPEVSRYAYWSDETIRVRLHASHYSTTDWSDAKLEWAWDGTGGNWNIPALPAGTVEEFGVREFAAPPIMKPHM